jgi:type IV secretion system protein VirB5
MSHALLSPPRNLKPAGVPETAYFKARQSWDERLGDAVIRAKNWRLAFFAEALLLLLLASALLFKLNQPQVIPVIVGIDKSTGEPTVLGPASEQKYVPDAPEIKYFLAQFIRFVRSVPSDQVLIKQNWLRAYAFLRPEAASLLNELTADNEESPLKKIGKLVVSVQPLSIVSIPETASYQMRWKEVVYSVQGTKVDEYSMLGSFVIEISPPEDRQTLQENPLGLFIKTFEWNREL